MTPKKEKKPCKDKKNPPLTKYHKIIRISPEAHKHLTSKVGYHEAVGHYVDILLGLA